MNTLRDDAVPKIGRMPVSSINHTEMLTRLAMIWSLKNETAHRVTQLTKLVVDVAQSRDRGRLQTGVRKALSTYTLWFRSFHSMKHPRVHGSLFVA